MEKDINIWIERLSSLHRQQMRVVANEVGIQLVHFEILRFLSIANKYSNTAQCLSDYLGQTKGSISQSLKLIEEAGHIERRPCEKDGRVIRLYLTKAGIDCIQKCNKKFLPELDPSEETVDALKKILQDWQNVNSFKGFGQCKSCKHNISLDKGLFRCGLTGEKLSQADVQKICLEHEFCEL